MGAGVGCYYLVVEGAARRTEPRGGWSGGRRCTIASSCVGRYGRCGHRLCRLLVILVNYRILPLFTVFTSIYRSVEPILELVI